MTIKINLKENKYFEISKNSTSALDLSKKRQELSDWIIRNNGLNQSKVEDTTLYSSIHGLTQFRWNFSDSYQIQGNLVIISGKTLPFKEDIYNPAICKPLSTNPGRYDITISGYHDYPNMIKKTLDVLALNQDNKFPSLKFLDILGI
ncbi:MAG: hypothetical protein WC867_05890 [Candidatus Pacearchaeota archaeon]|jgi:hypothetical protein